MVEEISDKAEEVKSVKKGKKKGKEIGMKNLLWAGDVRDGTECLILQKVRRDVGKSTKLVKKRCQKKRKRKWRSKKREIQRANTNMA